MVDEMKKKMRRFEHLIGFTGSLDVTSRDSMKRLIGALKTRYKHDVQSSLRLHRLEFFYDLVERKRRKGVKGDDDKNVPPEKEKKKVTEEKEEEGQQEETSKEGSENVNSDEVPSIQAKDIDDWKDLMTLSKIYYVLEHPRSEGLTWKRRITKKRKIDKFGDMDLIEWRVTQNFHLRGLEEWAQSRSDARKLSEQQNDTDDVESDLNEDARELEELFEMLDPSGEKSKLKKKDEKQKKGPSNADKPFKIQDECIEDWTESYSEDSEFSDAEDVVEEIEDFPDEMERKMGDFDETKMLISEEEESITDLFSKYPEFLPYREEIFEQMDKAETLEEWYKLYHEICIVSVEKEEEKQLSQIIEEEEPIEESKENIAKKEEQEEAAKMPEIGKASEEEFVIQDVAKEVAEETERGTESETDKQKETIKMSKTKNDETAKEPEIDSEKEENSLKQGVSEEPLAEPEQEEIQDMPDQKAKLDISEQEVKQDILEQEASKDDKNKSSATKLNEQEKDIVSVEQELYKTVEVDKDREENISNDTVAETKDTSGKTDNEETTNQTDTEDEKKAKKSVSQEKDAGLKSDDEPNDS